MQRDPDCHGVRSGASA